MLLPIEPVANAPPIPNLKCLSTSTISTRPKYHSPTNIASPAIRKAIITKAASFGILLAISHSSTVNIASSRIKLNPIIKLIF